MAKKNKKFQDYEKLFGPRDIFRCRAKYVYEIPEVENHFEGVTERFFKSGKPVINAGRFTGRPADRKAKFGRHRGSSVTIISRG